MRARLQSLQWGIDDFAEDDVEQREPGKALNSIEDQPQAVEQPNGEKVSNSGDAAPQGLGDAIGHVSTIAFLPDILPLN